VRDGWLPCSTAAVRVGRLPCVLFCFKAPSRLGSSG
jgi:hypothetical protein